MCNQSRYFQYSKMSTINITQFGSNEQLIMSSSQSSSKKFKKSKKIRPQSFQLSIQSAAYRFPFTNKAILKQIYNTHPTARISKDKKTHQSKQKTGDQKSMLKETQILSQGKHQKRTIHFRSAIPSSPPNPFLNQQENKRQASPPKRSVVHDTSVNFENGTETSRRLDRSLHFSKKRENGILADSTAFIYTQERQIQNLLKKVRGLREQNKTLKLELRKQMEHLNHDQVQQSRRHSEEYGRLCEGLRQMRQKVQIISSEKQELIGKHRAVCEYHQNLLSEFTKVKYEYSIFADKNYSLEADVKRQRQTVLKLQSQLMRYKTSQLSLQNEYNAMASKLEGVLNDKNEQSRLSEQKNSQHLKRYYNVQQQANELERRNHTLAASLAQQEAHFAREEHVYQMRLHQAEGLAKIQRERIELLEMGSLNSQNTIQMLKQQLNGFLHLSKSKQQDICQISVLKGQIQRFASQIKQMQIKMAALQAQNEQFIEQIKQRSAQIDQLLKERQQLQSQLIKMNGQISIANSQKQSISAQSEDKLRLLKEQNQREREDKERELARLSQQLQILKIKLDDYDSKHPIKDNQIQENLEADRHQDTESNDTAISNLGQRQEFHQQTINEQAHQKKIGQRHAASLFDQEDCLDQENYASREEVIWTKLALLQAKIESYQRQKVDLQNIIFHKNQTIRNLEQTVQQFKDSQIKVKCSYQSELRKDKQSILNKSQALEKQRDDARKLLLQKEKALNEAEQRVQHLKRELTVQQTQTHLSLLKSSQCHQTNLLKSEINLKHQQMKVQELKNSLNCKENQIAQMTIILKDKETLISVSQQRIKYLETLMSQSHQQISQKQKKVCELQRQLHTERQFTQVELNQLRQRNHSLQVERSNVGQRIKEVDGRLTDTSQQLQDLQKKLQEAICIILQRQQSIKKQDRRIANAQDERQQLQKKLRDLQKMALEQSSIQGEQTERLRFRNLNLCEQVNSLKAKIAQENECSSRMRKDLDQYKWQLDLVKSENQSIQKIMNQELSKRKIIIEELVEEKKKLFNELHGSSH